MPHSQLRSFDISKNLSENICGSNLTTLDNWLFPATVSNKSNTETNPTDLISDRTQNHRELAFLQEGCDTLNTDESNTLMKQEPLIGDH